VTLIFDKDDQLTWDRTDAGLRLCFRLFYELHEEKPAKTDLEATKRWELELEEVRQWAHSLGHRRTSLCIKYQKLQRKTQ
jgi:hypothetical protein